MDPTVAPRAAHILSFAQTLAGGGVERALLRLAAGWQEADRQVTLVIGAPAGPLAAELPPGVAVIALGSPLYRALAALPQVARACRPDVIFCPGNHYAGIAAWTRLRLGRSAPPIVGKLSNALHLPGQGMLTAAGYRAWLRRHPLFLDRLVAMSSASLEEAATAMAMPRRRMRIIPNPPAQRTPGDASLPLPSGRFLLGVGRLEPQKRWDRAIAALPHLADREVTLVILGEGTARRALEQQAERLGIAHRVSMPGHARDPLPAMERAAALVLTSDHEGVPGVLHEALGVGTPVIATQSSVAIAEIVATPALGSIVARDDRPSLIAALDWWLNPRAPRPPRVAPPGTDSASRYLDLFDECVGERRG